jgi:predicted RNase H-like nuclease (RuvC/YqgF family)
MEGLMAILTETATTNDTHEWLSTLEDKVRAAAERIQALREENAALRSQVAGLEAQLAAAPGGEDPRWQEERREIRERVERLTRHLEELAEV